MSIHSPSSETPPNSSADVLPQALTASLGDGYDSMSGALRSSIVSGETVDGGTESEVYIRVTESVSELADALRVTQSLSVSYLALAKLDQKLEFVREQKVTNQSVSIVVYARKQLGTQTLGNPMIQGNLGTDVAGFVRMHGDSYVAGIARGGEYYGVYTFQSQTKEEQQSITASLKANGVYSGVTVEASIETAIEKTRKETETSWTFSQRVSGVSKPSLPAQDELMQYAIDFPDKDLDRPVTIGMDMRGYENVQGFTLDFDAIRRNRRHFVGGGIDDGLTESLVRIESLKDQSNHLEAIYETYDYSGDTGLRTFKESLKADFETIKRQFLAYMEDPLQSFAKPALPSLDEGTPILTYSKDVSELWGRDGGNPFDYGSVEKALLSQRRLVWIQLRGGKYVDRISVQYQDIHGKGEILRYGRDGGSDSNALSFGTSERVSEVKVRHGEFVDRLEVKTNEGAKTSAGRTGGKEAIWKADGKIVLGFQGRSGRLLDAIQVVYVTLEPATFKHVS